MAKVEMEEMGKRETATKEVGSKATRKWVLGAVAVVAILLGAPAAAQAADGVSNVNTNNTTMNGQTIAFGTVGQGALPASTTIYLWTNQNSGGFLNGSRRRIAADITIPAGYEYSTTSGGSGSRNCGVNDSSASFVRLTLNYTRTGFKSCGFVFRLKAGIEVGNYDASLAFAASTANCNGASSGGGCNGWSGGSTNSGSASLTANVTKENAPAAEITGPEGETATFDFGEVGVGAFLGRPFTITNTGTTAIDGDPTLSGASTYSIVSEDCPNPIPINSSCTVSVRYTPTAEVGIESGTLSISGGGASADFGLTGFGSVPTAKLEIDQESFDYGDTPSGFPLSRAFEITNTGNTRLDLTFALGAGTDPAIFSNTESGTCGQFLGVGLSCTYIVAFDPSATGPAAQTGSFSVSGTNALLPDPAVVSVDLSGLRGILVQGFEVQDAGGTPGKKSHSFGAVNLGGSASYTFTVENKSTVALTDLSTNVTGSGAARFNRTTTCDATLPRNASCTVTIQFTPNRTFTVYAQLNVATTGIASKSVKMMGAGAGIAILNGQNDNSSGTSHRRWADVIGAGGASAFGGDTMRAGFEVELGVDQEIADVQVSSTLTTNDAAPSAGSFQSVAGLGGGSVSVQRKPGSSQAFIAAGVPLSSPVGTGLGSYGFSNGNLLIAICLGGGNATTNDRRVWFRIVNDDGQVSTATGSILRLTNVNYGCPNGGPYISSQRILQVDGTNQPSGTMNAIVDKGDPIKLQFNTNNRPAPLLGGDPGFVDAVSWRLRNSATGTMLRWNGSAYAACAAPCTAEVSGSRYDFASRNTGTQQMDIVAPQIRGRWVIEAAPRGAGDDTNRLFHVGTLLVNDQADPALNFGGTLGPRPDTDTEYTIIANPVTDPGDSSAGGTAQVIEWDLNGDSTDGPATDGFEVIGEGDSAGSPPAEALTQSFDTTGKEPGPYTIRARVTDNGAIMASDNSARQKIFEYTTTINSLPEAITENFDLEADDPQGSGVEFRANDANDDSYYVDIAPSGSNDGEITDPLVTELDQNDPSYEWPADYTGNDTFGFMATDEKRSTGPAGTLTVRIRPNTTIDDAGVLDGGDVDNGTSPLLNPDPDSGFLGSTLATGAEFDFSSPQEPVVDYECRLLRDNPIGYTGAWATAEVVEDWTDCETINESATAATGGQGYENLGDGLYRFEVRAVNDVDVADGTPAFRTWRVDNTAPVAEVRVGPTSNRPQFQPRFSNQVEPTYNLRASDAERGEQVYNTFECRVLFGPLSGEWKDCGNPSDALGSAQFPLLGVDPGFGLTDPLSDDTYRVEFRSTDEVGNLGEVTLETLIIDTSPPQTALASGPEGLVNSRDLAYVISSTQANSTFDCRVVGANAGTVIPTSPCPGSSLPDGSRPRFTVPQDDEYVLTTAAIDPATNRDTEPLEIPFEVDATAPDTTVQTVNFGEGPTESRRTKSRTATVGFTGSDLDTTTSSGVRSYQCRLDSASEDAWKTCQSPERFGALSDGSHKLEVRTVDIAGNPDDAPEIVEWVVDRTPPVTTITQFPDPVSSDTDPLFAFTTNEAVSGSVCRLDGLPPAACTSPVTVTELNGTAPLSDGPHQLTVASTDIAGNVEVASAAVSWETDTSIPEVEMLEEPPAFTPTGKVDFGWIVWDGVGAERELSEVAISECRFDGSEWQECDRAFEVSEQDNSNGPHSFSVRATDPAGNVSPVMDRTWEVRGEPPVAPTVSASQPENGATTRLTAASISFGHPEEGSEVLEGLFCQLDSGPFRACSGNFMADGLGDGEHEFRVVARDAFGNQSQPAIVTWEVQSKAPVTTINSGPAALTRQRTATVTFASNLAGSFECRVDGAAWATCESPLVLTELSDGSHSVRVRAVSAVLPVGVKDPSPPTRAWTVDATAPDVTVDSAPIGSTQDTSGLVEFSSGDPEAEFQCKVNSAPWDGCESPFEVGGLTPGQVTVQIRALDPAGNLSDPVEAAWTVEVPRCPTGFQGTPPNCTEITPEGKSKPVKATLTGGLLVLPGLADEGAPFEGGQLKLAGNLYENGAFEVPQSGVQFDPLELAQDFNGIALNISIAISATGPGVGTLPPGGGSASFQLPVKAQVAVESAFVNITPEQNCSLDGIRFDLTGEWDEATGTISLSSDQVSFPAAPTDRCAPLGDALNGLAGLPRDDIGLSLDFTFEELPDLTPARLATPKVNAPRSARSGSSLNFGTQLRNSGQSAAQQVKVCLKSPTALIKGAAKRCQTVGTIAAGASKSVSFKLATKSGNKGKKARFQLSAEYRSGGGKIVTRTGHVTLMK
ncbi:MAG: choice-of-anchor D domain-containing protein [Solirubrobacterales bacterium]